MDVDMNNVLNTPDKIMVRSYSELKNDYSKAGAIRYYDVYSKMPLSVIIRNANLIYAEPYKGYGFISNLITSVILPICAYEKLIGMIQETIEKNKSTIGPEQGNDLKSLLAQVQNKVRDFSNIHSLISFVSEDMADTKSRIYGVYDILYLTPSEAMTAAEESLSNRLDTLADYIRIMLCAGYPERIVSNLTLLSTADPSDDEIGSMSRQMHLSEVLKRIMSAPFFAKRISALPMDIRHKIETVAETDGEVLADKKLVTHETLNEAYCCPDVLIDMMYENAINDDNLRDIYTESKTRNLMYEQALLNIHAAYLYNDYVNNPDGLYTESDMEDSESSAELLNKLNAVLENCDEIDSIIAMERSKAEAPGVISDHYDMGPEAPREGLSRRIQNAGLDADVKYRKAAASARQKSQGVKNAGKALAKIPNDITKSIDNTLEDWDDADDERRKEYIAKPGFRKKYWRLLKIACAHYLAFKINPIINIILFIAGKLSADKDKRIRNELSLELQTEVKVLEQKIEDAKANGDRTAVYKMMRTQDKLKQELLRVTTNAKHV